jgi:uncharacterized damage-inducible protein DinB
VPYERVAPFLEDWKEESASTEAFLRALTDASLGQAIAPGHRTLGRIARHLVDTIHEMLPRTGLRLPPDPAPPTDRASALADAYASSARALGEAVRSQWTDADLAVEDDMYGNRWKRGFTLTCLVHHQIHHRGQMSVLLRQAGLRVPGTFGPAREDWAAMGAPVPEI